MNGRLYTYNDLAERWQVSLHTARRWVLALERLEIIEPLRPTRCTVRLTEAQCKLLESARARHRCDYEYRLQFKYIFPR